MLTWGRQREREREREREQLRHFSSLHPPFLSASLSYKTLAGGFRFQAYLIFSQIDYTELRVQFTLKVSVLLVFGALLRWPSEIVVRWRGPEEDVRGVGHSPIER